ncbi:MAG: tRNA (guanosine(37)-N1)-methyltransferase TrmD [Candidatus Kapaibacterium sp.]
MRIDIVAAVPEILDSMINYSIVRNARDAGVVEIFVHNLHDYADDKFRHIDDYPFGGGAGMLIQCAPVFKCIDRLRSEHDYDEIIYMSADGERLEQSIANELSLNRNIIILAGHYKGVDQRVRDALITREISIGDYVMSGGEIPAGVLTDAIVRLLPGAMGHSESALNDSFMEGLLEAPQYTRPAEFRGMKVPEVLLSGDHLAIEKWRYEKALAKTRRRRPDMLED